MPPDVVNDFEAWAVVSSRLIGKTGEEQTALLTELGVVQVWKNANDAWSRAIASDIVDMRLDRAQRYAEICAAELNREESSPADALSLSDELSLQTTHRLRAHREVPQFVETMTPTHAVRRPTRGQAKTHLADRDFALPESEESTDVTSVMENGAISVEDVLPLDRYARFMAERAAGHESADAIDERYGLSGAERDAVMEAWQARLDADATLEERFQELLAEHADALNTLRR